MWCSVWCRVQTDWTSLIACCLWKATPLSQLCCSSCPWVSKFHHLIQQKRIQRERFLLDWWVAFSHWGKLEQDYPGTPRDGAGKDGGGGGDGKKPLPSVIWELLYQFTSLTECPFKGCWHTTFVSSVLRVYMKHPGTVDGIQWQHKLDETVIILTPK